MKADLDIEQMLSGIVNIVDRLFNVISIIYGLVLIGILAVSIRYVWLME